MKKIFLQTLFVSINKYKIILFVLSICTTLTGNAQNQQINLPKGIITIQKVFQEIETQTDFSVDYNQSRLDISKQVNVDLVNPSLTDVLNEVLKKSGFTYTIERGHIIIKNDPRTSFANDEKRSIYGLVTDEKGEAIIGANILEKGTTNGAITDIDGKFTLTVSSSAILQLSYIGYVTQEITVTNATSYNIRLKEDTQALDEVVVVGYGTIRRGELTSSISSVKSESFTKGSVQDAAQLIKGKVAGLGVILPNGDPTSSTQIILRGSGSLQESSVPLVIIDGVPGDLNTVAAEDIESIDVVKDGSAAAIYGTRGNNGVIFITTKKVRGNMPATIDVTTYMTTQQIKKKLNMMNAEEYRELVAQGISGTNDYGYTTDWLDEITRTPISYVTNFSLKGGNTSTNYIANINFNSGQGIIKRSDNKTFTTRIEVNHAMFENKLKLNFSLMGQEQNYTALGEGNSFQGSIYRNALINNPTERPKDDKGNWTEHTEIHLYENPVALLQETSGEVKNRQIRSFGTVTYTPIPQLFIKAFGSRTTKSSLRGYAESQKHISTIRDSKNGYASRASSGWTDNLLELTSQYKNVFGLHDVTALIGYSYQDYIYENTRMTNWDFPSDQYTYNNMSAGAALKRGEATEETWKEKSRLVGFFGRLNYNYDNRYLLTASVRREGSSKFGADHKWGTFPAFSAGWNVSNETFMEAYRQIINNLKIRIGFGVTGTIMDDSYVSLSKLGTGRNYYTENGWQSVIMPLSNTNPDLRWEKKEEWNLGFDYGFVNNRINGSIDLYKRKTKDMLWNYEVAMPPYLYSQVIANAGVMENKGVEINLNLIPVQTKDFSWLTSVNYSTNENKLASLSNEKFQLKSGFIDLGATDEPIQQKTHRLVEGGKVGDFYGYKVVDIDDNGRWIIEDKDGNPKPIIQQQPDDKKVLGNGLPKHFLNWNNTIDYKGFQLSILMRGAFGFDILNMPRLFYDNPIFLARGNLLNTAYKPKLNGKTLSNQQELQYVDYYIEKGDYWKIDNITVGYTFQLKDSFLRKLNVYITGNNLFTISGYSGIDPEVNISGLTPGIDTRERYPSTRTFTLGASLTF